MDIHIHVHHHFADLGELKPLFQQLLSKDDKNMKTITDALTDLQTQVAAETAIDKSAITLINGLGAQIKALADAPDVEAAIEALSAQVLSQSTDLAAAITANTPVAAPPPTT